MRYLNVATYSFVDSYGKSVLVHEMREIPKYPVKMTINVGSNDDLDEVASRGYVYGDGGERDSYKLYEANLTALLDANFDVSAIGGKLVVPS